MLLSASEKVDIDLIEVQVLREPRTKIYGSSDGGDFSQIHLGSFSCKVMLLAGGHGRDRRTRVCVARSCFIGDSATPHPFSIENTEVS